MNMHVCLYVLLCFQPCLYQHRWNKAAPLAYVLMPYLYRDTQWAHKTFDRVFFGVHGQLATESKHGLEERDWGGGVVVLQSCTINIARITFSEVP